jgi:CHAT domain-containing protein
MKPENSRLPRHPPPSTSADFFQRWTAGKGKVQKVEALRRAQLDLLLGKARPKGSGSGRGFSTREPEGPALAGYVDPCYWAPFVLMGNWR